MVVGAGCAGVSEGGEVSDSGYYGQMEFDEDDERLCLANDQLFSGQTEQQMRQNRKETGWKKSYKICEESEFAWYENTLRERLSRNEEL
jgi:hypothetical protein